jgi:hypothetical protein
MAGMGSVRQRLEAHVSKPVCAACHKAMDPLGFGLEGFDGIGASRTHDEGYAIDARGTMPDGRPFDGPVELSEHLANDPKLVKCIAQHLFTYALGRAPGAEEDSLLGRVAEGGSSTRSFTSPRSAREERSPKCSVSAAERS